jgi:hypothetical protein
MPESFMQDQTVPARWRVLGIINGFAIAGKPCYASNEWFAKELGCSIHTVSNAFAELEDKEEIYCTRTRRTRVAYRVKPEIATDFHLRPQPASISDSNQLNTISDSISDSNTCADEDIDEGDDISLELTDEEGNPLTKPKSKKTTPNMRAVFAIFTDQPARANWVKHDVQRNAAQTLFDTYGLVELTKRYQVILKHRGEDFCPDIFSPNQMLDKMSAMESFLKKNV